MGLADSTKTSGYITSSILNGANQNTGIYTLVENNEIINLKNLISNLTINLNSLTIYSKSIALRIVPNSKEECGFIYIEPNQSKLIEAGSIENIKILNNIGTEIYFEASYF